MGDVDAIAISSDGVVTLGNHLIPNDGNIGSVDADSMAINSSGVITFGQHQ